MSSTPPSAVDLEGFIKDEMTRVAEMDATLPFDPDEYAERLRWVRAVRSRDGIDVLVLTAPDTMCWLHGYSCRWYRWNSSTELPPGQATIVQVDHDRMFLIESGCHEELARLTSCVDDFQAIPSTGLTHEASTDEFIRCLIDEIRPEGWLRGVVRLERWSCVPNPAVAGAIEDGLRASGCDIVDATRVVRSVRRLKSPNEIAETARPLVSAKRAATASGRTA